MNNRHPQTLTSLLTLLTSPLNPLLILFFPPLLSFLPPFTPLEANVISVSSNLPLLLLPNPSLHLLSSSSVCLPTNADTYPIPLCQTINFSLIHLSFPVPQTPGSLREDIKRLTSRFSHHVVSLFPSSVQS